jgi:putative redox protein
MSAANTWSRAVLADDEGRSVAVDVNGFELACDVPVDPEPDPGGPTPMGLLAASLSACTAMSARTFLQRWQRAPGEISVRVAVVPGPEPALLREVRVGGAVEPDLREQLAAVVDGTPVTVLLRQSLTIRTVLRTGE